MSARLAKWLRAGFLGMCFLSMFLNTALAAEKEVKLPPYDVNGLTHGKIWIPWVAAFLFAAGLLALAFKNPHRSNLERQ